MIDIHSHILPDFDDGAENTEMSLEMLRESFKQGVTKVISTSHCYPKGQHSIDHFIERRRNRIGRLVEEMESTEEDFPQIYMGCELNLYSDISEYQRLNELCLAGSRYLLIEMPYKKWDENMIDIIYKTEIKGFVPVMAHIERFLDQEKSLLDSLHGLDVLYQVNAEAFADKKMSRFIDKLFETNRVQFVGTDMHNTEKRPPCIDKAREAVVKRYGEGGWAFLQQNNLRLIKNEEIHDKTYNKPKKKSLLDKILHR